MTRYYKIVVDGRIVGIGTADHEVSNEITKEEYEAILKTLTTDKPE